MSSYGLEILDRQQCEALLETQQVGRVGVCSGRAGVFPVLYALLDGEWVPIPPRVVLKQLAPDGNSHICASESGLIYASWLAARRSDTTSAPIHGLAAPDGAVHSPNSRGVIGPQRTLDDSAANAGTKRSG